MEKITTSKLPELVINSFFKAIDKGDIKIGEVLASERELSEQLEISRGSLREGLSILEFLGVISNKGNRKVLERDYQSIEAILKLLKLRDKKNIIYDFIEFREFIELKNIELACARATDEDIKLLGNEVEQLKTNKDAPKVDYNFHAKIAEMSKNEFLISITDLLFNLINDLRPKLIDYPGRKPYIEEECYKIYQAIKERNAEKAKEAMKEHLFFIESTLKVIDSL